MSEKTIRLFYTSQSHEQINMSDSFAISFAISISSLDSHTLEIWVLL